MGQQVLEGTWEEILGHAGQFSGRRVRLTILDGELNAGEQASANGSSAQGGMIRRGMFPQLKALTAGDFKSAEWHGEDAEGGETPNSLQPTRTTPLPDWCP